MNSHVLFDLKRIFTAVCGGLFLSAAVYAASPPPNFVIIYADDLGYADTSVQMMDAHPSTKHSFIQTPGLDRLAQIGARAPGRPSNAPENDGSMPTLIPKVWKNLPRIPYGIRRAMRTDELPMQPWSKKWT